MNDAPQPPAPPPIPPPIPTAQPAAPVPRRSGAGPKILVGCLVALVVVGVLGGLVAWWGARKLGDLAQNPAAFAAKMIVAANPELEIVSQDDGGQTVTIRNKKTGELLTMNAKELEEGKIRFTNEDGEEITIDTAKTEGDAAITVKSKDGTTTLGADGAASVPAWVPTFPGAKPTGAVAKRSGASEEGAFTFETTEPVAKVLDHYQAQLQGSGYEVERSVSEGEGFGMGMVTGTSAAEHREVTVVVLTSEEGKAAQVNVQYASGKE